MGYLGRYQKYPVSSHWTALKRMVRYLKDTMQTSLKFLRVEKMDPLLGYADADWATDQQNRKPVSGYVFKVFGNAISWSSKK